MQKEKNQTVLERKQQMGHLITRYLAFILLERSIWGCSLAPKGTGTSIQSFKMAEIFEPATKFFYLPWTIRETKTTKRVQ